MLRNAVLNLSIFHQLLVFLAVMRKTYGFNKKLDWVSNEQLSELTGILPHKCSAAKSVLV
ncbi:TPA: replication protein, partial [Escherichia coli]|nr:replication protein [Escherichia coli]EFE6418383.1 replication protein [Escherichia coli]HAL8049959.1 replication protein [Escherichia coli]HCN9502368.1 replication protein [Escherichia coli]HCN9688326.1 replication protein [Escherichia coli]